MKYEPRYEHFDGRKHMVVPVVIMKTNLVRKGTRYSQKSIIPAAWDGIPVTVTHDGDDIGRLFNVRRDGDALRGEAWLRLSDLMNEPSLYDRLRNGEPVEVSMGIDHAWGDRIDGVAEVTDAVPEHVALLPDKRGAFSINDGCGVRGD